MLGGVAQQSLHEQREQDCTAQQRESQHEHQHVGGGERPVGEQVQINHRVFARPLPIDQEQQGRGGNDRENHNEMGFEPVFALPLVQNNLQRAQAQSHQAEADVINLGFRKFFTLKVRRILN